MMRRRSAGICRSSGRSVCFALIAACVSAPQLYAQTLRFSDGTPFAGISTNGPAQGVAVIDIDRDGYDDIFFAAAAGASALFLNNGNGTFRDVTLESGINVPGNAVAPVWVDVNNDGAHDLFVGIRSGPDPNKLYLNDGQGAFHDVIESSGIDPTSRVGSATFGDFDADGYLDLFIATRGDGDRLYKNLGDANFSDITAEAGVAGQTGSVAMQATWVDFDRDGDLDLFAVHDGIVVNRLYRNDGSLPFSDVAAQMGIDQVGSGNGMGVAWFDSDLDGYDDVYVTRIGIGSLYRNQGNNSFSDVATEAGAEKNGLTWGVVAADFDNDGDDDLFMVNTHSFDNVSETFLYQNDGGHFTNVARSAGAALKLDSFGVAGGDFNADGLIDVAITSTAGDNRLLINATQDAGNWVGVELRDGPEKGIAFGAAVRVVADGAAQRKSLFGAQGYCSQNSGHIQFGVGSATVVDTLEVLWPSGEAELYLGLDPNKSYVLIRGFLSVANEAEQPSGIDMKFDLYPNPFTSSIRAVFSLDDEADVHLDVLDVLGRRVANVAGMPFGAGEHTVSWSGNLQTGRPAPAGLYFLRLEANGQAIVRSVVRSN